MKKEISTSGQSAGSESQTPATPKDWVKSGKAAAWTEYAINRLHGKETEEQAKPHKHLCCGARFATIDKAKGAIK